MTTRQEHLDQSAAELVYNSFSALNFDDNFDSCAQTYWGAMSVTPSDARKELDNWLFKRLKCVLCVEQMADRFDTLWLLAHETEQGAKLNAAKRDHDLQNPYGSVTWMANRGYTGHSATNGYIDTNYAPGLQGVNLTQNNGSLGVYTRLNLNVGSEMGVQTSGSPPNNQRLTIATRANGSSVYRVNQVNALSVTNSDGRGLFIANRPNVDNCEGYKDGLLVGSSAQQSAPPPAFSLTLFANNVGGNLTSFNNNQIAIAFAAGAMSPAEIEAVYSIFQAYLTVLGAAV